MRHLALLIGVLMTAACGSPSTPADFDEAISDVLAEFSARGLNIVRVTPITFGNTGDSQGRCTKSPTGNRVIIDQEQWMLNNRIHHKYLIAHELGHCMLNLEHDNSLIQFEGQIIPKTIMNENVDLPFSQALFANEYYFDELLGI